MNPPLTPADSTDVNALLATRPPHVTRRMSWPVDPDTTRRLKRVIALTEGEAGLRWYNKLLRWPTWKD